MSRTLRRMLRGAREVRTLQAPSAVIMAAFGAEQTYSGSSVSVATAQQHADVWACVRVLTDASALIPLRVWRDSPDGGRIAASDTYASRLVANPAPAITQAALVSTMVLHLSTWGNAFVAKYRNGTSATSPVVQLGTIDPARVLVRLEAGEPIYTVTPSVTAPEVGGTFTRRDILHIKALSGDGLLGLSPVHQARQAIGTGMALEEYAGRYLDNNSTPAGVLQTTKVIGEQGRKSLKAEWESLHRGARQSGRVGVLEDGVEFHPIGLPPADFQYIEQRKLSATQIARIFRVPPYFIGADSGASMTYSNVEQESEHLVRYAIQPLLTLIEQGFRSDEDIFGLDVVFYPAFDYDALLRASTVDRFTAYAIALGKTPWMTPNEPRQREGLPLLPADIGDVLPSPAGKPTDQPQPPSSEADAADAAMPPAVRSTNGHGETTIEELTHERD